MTDMVLSVSDEGRVTLMGGRTVLAAPGCGVRSFPGGGTGSVLTGVSGAVVVDALSAVEALVVVGGFVLMR